MGKKDSEPSSATSAVASLMQVTTLTYGFTKKCKANIQTLISPAEHVCRMTRFALYKGSNAYKTKQKSTFNTCETRGATMGIHMLNRWFSDTLKPSYNKVTFDMKKTFVIPDTH